MATLFRSTFEVQSTEGRELVGLALKYDRPVRVRDLTGPAYLEEFDQRSTDRSLAQHDAKFPVFKRHDYTKDPLGVVMFRRSTSEGGLLFSAPLSKTRDADEALELVNDGALSSVSVGFRPVRHITRGQVTHRTEVALRELSLAPTGFGQIPDARVHAIRSEDFDDDDASLERLQRRLALLIRP